MSSTLKVLFSWAPERGLDLIRGAAPDLEIKASDDPRTILRWMPDAEVLCVGALDEDLLREARRLRWIHAMSGGVENYLLPELRESGIPLTCLRGCFDTPAAEHCLAMMLAFSRRLEYDIRQRPFKTFVYDEPTDLSGATLGIVGLGSIGRAIARRAKCVGMHVAAISRSGGECEGVEVIGGPAGLHRLLGMSDYVAVAVPLTSATRGLMGEAELRAMKRGAYLIDISGRPAIYDLEALTRALQECRLAGAALQIEPEPDSPLWGVQNLLISFHRSTSRQQFDRCFERFCANLRRYRAGEPLLGLVDWIVGY